MILVWISVWALAGQPPVSGWWLVLMVLAAISSVVGPRSTK